MSLKSVINDMLAEVGWPQFNAIASNTEATAKQCFSLINTELAALSERKDWMHLTTEYDFPTVNGQSIYPLPADYRSIVANSAFEKTQYYQIKGSIGVAEWNWRTNGFYGNLNRWAFRLLYSTAVPSIQFTPEPVDVEDLVISYISTNYAKAADNTPQPLYVLDTDVSRVPEVLVGLGLKWRFRRAKGLDFSAELAEYNSRVDALFSKYAGQADIPVGGRRWSEDTPLTPGFVPDGGFPG